MYKNVDDSFLFSHSSPLRFRPHPSGMARHSGGRGLEAHEAVSRGWRLLLGPGGVLHRSWLWRLFSRSWFFHKGECSHHWPPTTTPVFGQCGPVPECQVSSVTCDTWHVMTPGGGHVVQGGVGRCPLLRGAYLRSCGCSRWTNQVGNLPSNVRQWDFGIKLRIRINHSLSQQRRTIYDYDYEIRPALNAWFQLWTVCANCAILM